MNEDLDSILEIKSEPISEKKRNETKTTAMGTVKGGEEGKKMTTKSRKILLITGLIGSLLVIIAFFLPWAKVGVRSFGASVNGINMVKGGIGCFKMARYSEDWIVIGISMLLFILTPILCSIILALGFYSRGKSSLFFSIFPIIIWIAYLIAGLSYIGEEYLRVYGSSGAIITIIGMVTAFVVAIMLKSKKEVVS